MAEDTRDWELETKLVRGGLTRTPYGEISEALFLTQSFRMRNRDLIELFDLVPVYTPVEISEA